MLRSILVALFVLYPAITAHAAVPATGPATKPVPTLFIIGDSTVHNDAPGIVGWGNCIGAHFDTNRIRIVNRAIGGRSSRTFISEGRWDEIIAELRPGDFVLMQFGHNDESPVNDATRARGTVKGVGDETEEIDNQLTGKHEVVHTYGWYMRKYISDTKNKGAIAIVCSPVPRCNWKDGKFNRSAETAHPLWAKQVAEQEQVAFIALYNRIADDWEKIGQEKVTAEFFPTDHTHTALAGAKFNAQHVIDGIFALKDCALAGYIVPAPVSQPAATTLP